MKAICTLLLAAGVASQPTLADIRIDAIDAQGQPVIFSSNGQSARVDNLRENKYALVDMARQRFMLVNPRQHAVLLLDNTASEKQAPAIDIELKALDKGPDIAGFTTRKFQLRAEGKNCAVIYGSQTAAQQPGLKKLFDALQQLQQRISAMMNAMQPVTNVCSLARAQTAQIFSTTGLPLRIENAGGKVQSRITRIESAAPAQDYKLPANFKVTRMQDQIKEMERQRNQAMQEIQQQMPDMQKMIEQLQQTGKMPDEAIEQLRKMKDLIKQRTPQ